jgi:D-cysteine desulfhydrase
MERKEPLLFKKFPNLKNKVPWISILHNLPTPIERLSHLEDDLNLKSGEIYIKRDDKNHPIYGGNKLRKFEFIFGDVIKKKKKGIATLGGIGTNHGMACTILSKNMNPPLMCDLFLFSQPLTWHVQRSLLLFDYFGAKLHLGKGDVSTFIKFLFFQLNHPKYYLMFPGGTPLFGIGTPLGTIGFVNAIFELKSQIEQGEIPEPDAIFVPGGTTGTGAGLVAGCKLLGLKTKVHIVAVYGDLVAKPSSVVKNANKALKYLSKHDRTIPQLKVSTSDFEFITGYLGSNYGKKTIRGQYAVDTVMKLEGKKRHFKLETTYTGKALAALFDYMRKEENASKKVLFWNTYNSNDLDQYVKETNFNYPILPKKFHQFFKKKFQCWQLVDCPSEIKKTCSAYMNHEYRFWKVTECKLSESEKKTAFNNLNKAIELENA